MDLRTKQEELWAGEFGKEWSRRNLLTPADLDKLYTKNYGCTRKELNFEFLDKLDRSIRILEVGSNTGTQLIMLQEMGFKSLYGIDILDFAVELAKTRTKNINIIQGSAFDIPFKDGFFDLVFTSGLLIHFDPKDVKDVLKEIQRCTRKYIWVFEYFADTYTKIDYRGHEDLLWKANFAKLFTDNFKDLKLVKEKRLKYLENDNVDTIFLLEKKKK